ncbi:MAG: O-antigen ligase family protein, partial [Gammaproteobacteria bacterium]|nr:O-antigen ligase family protein [Gammaproteobacteria bacterium]
AFAHQSANSLSTEGNFTRRRNLWFALTLAAFLTQNFWIYTAIAIPLLVSARRHESNLSALFFFTLLALPMTSFPIPGMGLSNVLFNLSHVRLLELFILFPAFVALKRQGDTTPFGRTAPDKALAAYLLLTAALFLRETSLTNSLRETFYLFIDVFLPYFVISRSLKNTQSFREALLSLVLAIMVLAPIAAFESVKRWLLYSSWTGIPELEGDFTNYLARDGILRALATAGQPIALGYLMVVGIGLYLFIHGSIQQKLFRRIGAALLVIGLIAPLSRGPWVGAAVLVVVFILTGRYAIRRLISLVLATIIVLPLLSILPGGEKIINLLPFIGATETQNVDYRERLITNSMIVIERNPWFGSVDFLETPEMQSMRQGQGIIDIVNSYIRVALELGLVGLGLFVGFFVLILLNIIRTLRNIPDKHSEEYLLGRVLLSTLIAILVIIFTVSSITFIPIIYWSVAALGLAYTQMVQRDSATSRINPQGGLPEN